MIFDLATDRARCVTREKQNQCVGRLRKNGHRGKEWNWNCDWVGVQGGIGG